MTTSDVSPRGDFGRFDPMAVVRGFKREVKSARKDPANFFSFVMVNPDDTTRRLQCAAHQRFGFEFAMWHPFCVLRWPTDTGKTLFSVAFGLYLVGADEHTRGLYFSKVGEISQRQIMALHAYLDPESPLNARVRAVFPHLQLSQRESDPQTMKKLTTIRDGGSLDPTYTALGLDSSGQGKKVHFAIGDDVIDDKNTRTPEIRKEVKEAIEKRVLGRLPPTGGRALITNVPWDREDVTFAFEKDGWPTVEMDIYGSVKVTNAAQDFETDLLRPSQIRSGQWHRLTEHDPDPDEKTPLFPARWPLEAIEKIRYGDLGSSIPPMNPRVFAQQKLCQPSSSETERCPLEWWERCQVRGMPRRHEHRSEHPIITGFDIGLGDKASSDKTAQVTYEYLSETKRRLLWVESWTGMNGPTLVRKIYEVLQRYGGWIGIESNAAQKFIVDFSNDDPSMDEQLRRMLRTRVLRYETKGQDKHHLAYGVESLFGEVELAQWEVPCSRDGVVHDEIRELQEEAKSYDPLSHTGDRLMAWWIARRTEERVGMGARPPRSGGVREMAAQARQGLDMRGNRSGGDLVSSLIARQYPGTGRRRF